MGSEKSLDDIYDLINTVSKKLSDKIERVSEDLKAFTIKVEKEVQDIKQQVSAVEKENKYLKERLQAAERTIRKNNIILYGVKEEINETTEVLLTKIQSILNKNLSITLYNTQLKNVFRLGKGVNKERPVLIQLLSHFTKIEILRNKTKLKGTGIYVSEDLINEDRQIRQNLVKHLKDAKSNNKSAVIKGTKLVIEGKIYTHDDLQNNKHRIASETGYYSPPTPRQITSEPATPVTTKEIFEIENEEQELEDSEEQNEHIEEHQKRKRESPGSAETGTKKKINQNMIKKMQLRNREK